MLYKKLNNNILQTFNKVLGGDEATTEDIYIFLVYLHFGAIKAAYPAIKTARNGISNYLKQHLLKDEPTNAGSNNIKLLFERSENIILEIIEEIWNNKTYDHELKWLEKWIEDCRLYLQEIAIEQLIINSDKIFCEVARLPYSPLEIILNSFFQLSESLLNKNKLLRID